MSDGYYDDCTIKIIDSEGNESNSLTIPPFTVNTTVIDTTAPTVSVIAATITSSGNAVVQSSETGTAYLVNTSVTVSNLASIIGAADNQWNSIPISSASTNTDLAATGLVTGTYKVYVLDAAGNLSSASSNSVTVTDSSLMGGAIQGAVLSDPDDVTTFAGPPAGTTTAVTTQAVADATGTDARFYYPSKITTDGTNLYVAEYLGNRIRKIVIATADVTTLAGSGETATTDGTGTDAKFNRPFGITTDGTNLYVAEYTGNKIRKIVIATGVVTTLAGSGTANTTDGTGTDANFYNPSGITTDGTSLYVAGYTSNKIRKIE